MIRPRITLLSGAALAALAALVFATAAAAQAPAPIQNPAGPVVTERPWMDTHLSADQRAGLLLKAMTQAEKLSLVFGIYSTKSPSKHHEVPEGGIACTAGFVPGVNRLGIPPQWQTDAGLGVSTHRTCPTPRGRTSLPSGIATAATWNPQIAHDGGVMIGREARASGHNVLLAGGINLLREPRNGRNFEYAGEDPLLAGTLVGETIKGIQSNHIVATIKHYAFNNQETNRFTVDVHIGEAAARQSDLLAFELAIASGQPGSVMCSYNRLNGDYACESDYLLNKTLKQAWHYPGYVMSDWGATHSTTEAALAGLDQQSGWPFDVSPYFADALREAVTDGHVPQARLDDMVERNLHALFATGVFDFPVSGPVTGPNEAAIDFAADGAVSQADAEEGIVLLKNNGILPLAASAKSILVIGGHADKGVLSGGGSSQVYPVGGLAVPNEGPTAFPGPMVFHPSSPVKALIALTKATVTYIDGKDHAAAAKAARKADIVIVFATQWMGESIDAPTMNLPNDQDGLISAVAGANRKTVVVLETGGPVAMPWVDKTAAVLEAWYPGTSGGVAIARVLTGEVNPSGHLPATFPVDVSQLPRPKVDGDPANERAPASTNYDIEGAAIGYKWFDKKGLKPLFPFGYGLSYTKFAFSGLSASLDGDALTVKFTAANTGRVAGKAVPQIYVAAPDGRFEAPKRLAGWSKLDLEPGAASSASVTVDPRLLASFDPATGEWVVTEGDYDILLAASATDIISKVRVHVPARRWAN